MKREIFKFTVRTLVVAICAIFVSSCSSVEEPLVSNNPNAENVKGTRNAESANGITEDDAIQIAREALNLTANDRCVVSYAKDVIGDDTEPSVLAYVVNFNKGGFAVVANRNSRNVVLAKADEGYLGVKDGIIDDPFLANLKPIVNNFFNSERNKANSIGTNCLDCTHYLYYGPIYRNEQYNVNIYSPYNYRVAEEHPGYNASVVPTCCAIMTSFAVDEFKYKYIAYYFSWVTERLLEGPKSSTNNCDINVINPGQPPYLYFFNNYDGAVSAMQYLIRDLSNDMDTSYVNGNASTSVSKAYSVLKNLGLDVTNVITKINYGELLRIIEDNLVLATFRNVNSGDEISIILDGYEVIASYDNGRGPYDCVDPIDLIFCYDPSRQVSAISYDAQVLFRSDYNMISCFGVKKR